MKCNSMIGLLTILVFLIGLSAPAFAGGPLECELIIEINALRGGSPTVLTGGTKDITSKARIQKGTAPGDATVTDTVLTIDTVYDGEITHTEPSPDMLTLVVGKGGQGDKLTMPVPDCSPGEIVEFVSHFVGTGPNGATCRADSNPLRKTCK